MNPSYAPSHVQARDGRHLWLLVGVHILLGLVMMTFVAFMFASVFWSEPSRRQARTERTTEEQSPSGPDRASSGGAEESAEAEGAGEKGVPEWTRYLALGVFVLLAAGLFGGLLLWFGLISIAPFVIAWNLARRQHRNLCLTAAAIECTNMPFGTILGVMTILVLSRQSVRMLFLPAGQAGDPEREGAAK